MSEDYEARAHKQIQIESWSNSARTLHLRGATTGGPFAESHTTNADRSRATDTFELHGLPTKLQVCPSAAPVRRGECYVRVTLLMDGEPVQRLAAAYLTDSKPISWPPGQFEDFLSGPGLIKTVTGTNPAAAVEVSEACPANARWRLLSAYLVLTTDANVANRTVNIVITDGASTYQQYAAGAVQTASLGYNYIIAAGYPIKDTAIDARAFMRIPIPNDVILFQGWTLDTVIDGKQAGDDWSTVRLVVEEWIEE